MIYWTLIKISYTCNFIRSVSTLAPPSVKAIDHPYPHPTFPPLLQQAICQNVPSTVITDCFKLSTELLSLSLPLLFLSPYLLPNSFYLSQPFCHKQV